MKVTLRVITSADAEIVAMLDAWAAVVTAHQGAKECCNLRDRVKATGTPDFEVNYGIFVDERFVGGIHTSGEYFNVMWVHWDESGKGVGPRAAYEVLSAQIKKYMKAIVNQPNKKMCKALVKIMTRARKANLVCRDGIAAMTFSLGDLRKP